MRSRELHRFTLQERYEINVMIPVNSRPRKAKVAEATGPSAPAPAATPLTPSNQFQGCWQIDWAALWDLEVIDSLGTAFIQFDEGVGKLKLAAIEGALACEYARGTAGPPSSSPGAVTTKRKLSTVVDGRHSNRTGR